MCFLPAVERSITTSFRPSATSPSTRVSELNSGCDGSTLNPRFGAPPKLIDLPSLPIRCAPSPPTPPSAALTSGSCFTLASSDSSNDGSVPLPLLPRSKADLPVIDRVGAAVGLGEDRIEGARDRVREDERAADHRDAEDDREGGQRGAQLAAEQALEREAGHLASSCSIAAEDVVRRRARQLAHDLAVGEEEHAVGHRGGAGVVGDHHDRLAQLVDRVAELLEDLAARGRVEVARRLVGEDDRRPRDERAGDRDALLLAAGELGGPVRPPVGDPDLGRAARRPTPCPASRRRSSAAGATFSSAVSIGSRLKNWKMKPMCSRRSFVRSASSRSVISVPSMVTVARSSAGRARRGCA